MSTTNDLLARLLEHAAEHQAERDADDDEASLYGMRHGRMAMDLREAAVLVERTQWRDIETAPRDYEQFHAWIVAADGREWFEPDCYIDGEGDIRDSSGSLVGCVYQWATHWIHPIAGPPAGA